MRKKKGKIKKTKHSLLTLLIALAISFLYWINENPIEPTAQTVHHAPEEGSPANLFSNMAGDHLQNSITSAIASAKSSVNLLIYSLNDKKIIEALKKKSEEEGVSVKVVYDAKASAGVDKKLGSRVNATARASEGLMHQKILVIDEQEVWLGSANFTSDSLFSQSNLVTAMKSSSLAKAILEKVACFSEGSFEKKIPAKSFQIGDQKLELWFLPDCHQDAVNRLAELINSAKKTIQVSMFTFTREDLAKSLIKAKNRGVKVEVFLDHQSSKGASAKIASLLSNAKIPISTNPGQSIFHCKYLLIDNEVLVNGSANWTKAAFKQNDDCFIIVHNLNEGQKKKMSEIHLHLKKNMSPLKLALFGNGKMGKLVQEIAKTQNHELVLSPEHCDLCIDFTHPSSVLKNIELAAKHKKNIVVGTTGWENDLPQAKQIVQQSNIGLLYSPNFSIGVHLFINMLKKAGLEMRLHPEYDVAGIEIHHKQKVDAPSGTAKAIAQALSSNLHRDIVFSSVRVGEIPGTHTIMFDSPFDTITLTHEAKGRHAFAAGAIKAAEWLHGKKGFYTLEDIL